MRDHTKLRAFELADEIAYGSLKEAGYQLKLAIRLRYTTEQSSSICNYKIVEAEKVLCSLIKSMRQ